MTRAVNRYQYRDYKRVRPLVVALALTLSATGAWADAASGCTQLKDPDRQIRCWTQIIERGEREGGAFDYLSRGIAYFTKGEVDKAIVDYTQAIKLNPKDTDAYYNRGIAYKKKGELDRAIADYSKAIEVNPKYAKAYSNRGIAYEKKGDKEQAIADYREALEFANTNQFAKQGLKRLGVTP